MGLGGIGDEVAVSGSEGDGFNVNEESFDLTVAGSEVVRCNIGFVDDFTINECEKEEKLDR